MQTGKRKKVAMQPIVMEGEVARFQANRLVTAMYELGSFKMNEAWAMVNSGEATRAEYEQLAQLIGYSVSGFGDISLARKRVKEEARKKVQRLLRKRAKQASRRPWGLTFDGPPGTIASRNSVHDFELESIEVHAKSTAPGAVTLQALAIEGVDIPLRYRNQRWYPTEKVIVRVGHGVAVMVESPVGVDVKLNGKVVAP